MSPAAASPPVTIAAAPTRAAAIDRVMRYVVLLCAGLSVVIIVLVVLFIAGQAKGVLSTPGLGTFVSSLAWQPDGSGFGGDQTYGALMPILGSVEVVGLALFLAVPLSLAIALVLEETNPIIGTRVLRPAIEVFVGIPSVVYGYLGFVALLPLLRHIAPPGHEGSSFLAASVVLAIMVTPTIATISADGLHAVPRSLKEASMALGATQWQTIRKVLLPTARASIISGTVLGLARAMGEALAVAMVIGDVNNLPGFREYGIRGFVTPTTTMTVTITDGINNLAINPDGTAARYALALVLLVITFSCIVAVRIAGRAAPRVSG